VAVFGYDLPVTPNTSAPVKAVRPRTCTAIVPLAVSLVAACTVAACSKSSSPGAPTARVDNVILVTIDSLRADHLGAYGYPKPTSPTFDSLAARGLALDRAYSTSSWTLPSHAALLTGLENVTHRVRDDSTRLPNEIETLAESLRAAGIRTTGFFSGPYLHPSFGLGQGFDDYVNCTSYATTPNDENPKPMQFFASHHDVTNPILFEAVNDWAKADKAGARNFVFIHMWDVHYDYIAPKQYVDMFDPDYTGTFTAEKFEQNEDVKPGMPERDLQHLLALYDAEIRYTDETLGKLLNLLAKAGLSGRTAIIVTADHGEEFLDHGKKGHRQTLYEEVLHIPMVLVIDGQTPASPRTDAVVSLVDVYPTVCELLGVSCPAHTTGQSLLPLFDGAPGAASRGDALAELTVSKFGVSQSALVRADDKLIRYNGNGRAMYYTRDELVTEKQGTLIKPRADEQAEPPAASAIEQLRRREGAAKEAGRQLYSGVVVESPKVDESTQHHLKALGYTD